MVCVAREQAIQICVINYHISCPDELLTSTSALLDLLLNSSDQLLVEWVDGQLVDSVCEAIQQTR